MPTFTITVAVSQDGVSVPGFPIVRRLAVQESVPSDLSIVAGGTKTLPLGSLSAVTALMIRSLDQPVSVPLGTVTLNAGGIVLLFDGTFNAPAVHNATGSAAEVQALGGGTA